MWTVPLYTQQATHRHHAPTITQNVTGTSTELSKTQSIASSLPPVVPPHDIQQSVLFPKNYRVSSLERVQVLQERRDMVAVTFIVHLSSHRKTLTNAILYSHPQLKLGLMHAIVSRWIKSSKERAMSQK